MASLLKFGTVMRDAMANAFADTHDGGTPPARIEIRTGAQPTNVSDASSGTKLGTLLHDTTAYGSSSAGAVTAAAITSDTSADASGTAEYFRVYQGGAADTAALLQGNAGTASVDMVFDNATIVAGGVIAISSMVFTVSITQA